MIGGIIALVTLIFIRFQGEAAPVALPDSITLPDGTRPVAFTQTPEWYAIVTDDYQIMIFDTGGALLQTIKVSVP